MTYRDCILILFFLLTFSSASHAELIVTYPKPQSEHDIRYNDIIELLKLSLDATRGTHGCYTLTPAENVMIEKRQYSQLDKEMAISIMSSSTWKELETKFIHIRIQLRKG